MQDTLSFVCENVPKLHDKHRAHAGQDGGYKNKRQTRGHINQHTVGDEPERRIEASSACMPVHTEDRITNM